MRRTYSGPSLLSLPYSDHRKVIKSIFLFFFVLQAYALFAVQVLRHDLLDFVDGVVVAVNVRATKLVTDTEEGIYDGFFP